MKNILWIIILLGFVSKSVRGQTVIHSEFSYKKTGDDFTLYVSSYFSIGYEKGPKIGLVQYRQSSDTLYAKVYYDLTPIFALVGSVSKDTLYYHNTFKGINYLNISTNYYENPYYPDPENDTTRNLFDSTFNIAFSVVRDIAHQNICTIYPIPAHDIIYLNPISKIAYVRVIDPLGRVQMQASFQQALSIQSLSPGYYFLLWYNEQNELLGKTRVIKQG